MDDKLKHLLDAMDEFKRANAYSGEELSLDAGDIDMVLSYIDALENENNLLAKRIGNANTYYHKRLVRMPRIDNDAVKMYNLMNGHIKKA